MRRFINVILQLVAAVFAVFLFTVIWILFDGLTDLGEKADVALVTGHSETPPGKHGAVALEQLDRVIKLYNDNDCPFIIVIGSSSPDGYDQSTDMVAHLKNNGIPANAIIEGHPEAGIPGRALQVAAIMKAHQFDSIMLVTDYYYVTRTKLALNHEGVVGIEKAHVGSFHKSDFWKIGHEVVMLYKYLGKTYLLPAVEKAKEEAATGLGKAKTDAEKAKGSVNHGLDNMSQ
jgi:vancomycin permeability regulator SanA